MCLCEVKLAAKERKVQLIDGSPCKLLHYTKQLVNSHRAPMWGVLASGDGQKGGQEMLNFMVPLL